MTTNYMPGNVIKVALAGSHGVGKTTLVDKLAEELELDFGTQVVEETASRVFEMGKEDPALQINQGATMEAQLKILGMQIQEENEKVEKLSKLDQTSLLLCDRSAFDAIAYTFLRVNGKDGKYAWAKGMITHLYRWVCDSLSTPYDIVFYLPISFPLQSSEVRPGDEIFQEQIDALMQEMLFHRRIGSQPMEEKNPYFVLAKSVPAGINEVAVLSGTPERRIAIAKKKIEEIVAKKKAAALTSSATITFGNALQQHMQHGFTIPCNNADSNSVYANSAGSLSNTVNGAALGAFVVKGPETDNRD